MATISLPSISGAAHHVSSPSTSSSISSFTNFIPKNKSLRRRRKTAPLLLQAALVEPLSPTTNSKNGVVVPITDSSSIPSSSRDRMDDMQAEGRAMSRAANASIYSPQLLSIKYGSRPINVLTRSLQILTGIGSFAFTLWVDQLQDQLNQRRRIRAIELRNTLTGLGPTFVKIGQGLSTRPDLCPPEYLEELSELQVYNSTTSII